MKYICLPQGFDMLKSQELSYQYKGETSINFPDFELKDEVPMLILGPSGCGKSTLLHLLGGLLTPASGSIVLNNIEYSNFKGTKLDKFRGENIGMVFQQHHFIQSLTMLENLEMACFLAGKKLDNELLTNVVDQVNIGDVLDKKNAALSIGQQQRMAIARALVIQPKIILADEPTSSLDGENCQRVIELLLDSAKAFNSHLVVVTHDNRVENLFTSKMEL